MSPIPIQTIKIFGEGITPNIFTGDVMTRALDGLHEIGPKMIMPK